jgi:hypothetical protein
VPLRSEYGARKRHRKGGAVKCDEGGTVIRRSETRG